MTKLKYFIFVLSLLLVSSSSAFADYALPIPFEVYTLNGTWDTDFELTDALKTKIASEWPTSSITVNDVHSFADIALNQTWTADNQEFVNLAYWGSYGVTTLPLTQSGTGDDVYVVRCSFGDDIEVDERIEIWGFNVDTTTLKAVYNDEENFSGSHYVLLDENFNRVFKVPESKKIYVALSLIPSYINTGILSVIRGEYIVEDDPEDRLDVTLAQKIADELGIDVSQLKYLSQTYLGKPVEPTEAMKEYVKSDDHEIIANLPTLSTDKEGYYVVRVTLSDEDFNEVKDKNVSDYKLYGLNDSSLGDEQFQPAFIFGLVNLWEIFSLQGKKLDKFGTKEFLMVGLLNAGKPFSFYLGKILLAILFGGGCETNFTPYMIVAVAFAALILYKRKFH